ncbi:MAG: hypothetical protein ABUS57_22080, partial [Pseudomonadota bacterium]
MLFGRPASGSANLALTQDKLAFENLETHWAQVVGTGRAQIAGGMFGTHVDVSGMLDGLAPELSGAVIGMVDYANARTGDNLQVNLALRGARLGAVAADEATASLTGPLAAMKAQLDAKGWANEQAITVSAKGDVAVSEAGWVAQLGARGRFAG